MAPPLPFRLSTATLPFLTGCGSSPSASGTAELVISGEYQGRLDTGHPLSWRDRKVHPLLTVSHGGHSLPRW
jgi:hypothetical protein